MKEGKFAKWAVGACAVSLIAAIVAVVALLGVLNQPVVKGITNFGTVVLSQDLTVGNDGSISGDLVVEGTTTLSEAVAMSGTVTLDSLAVNGTSVLSGAVSLSDTLGVAGGFTASGFVTVANNLLVTGTADFSSTIQYGTGNLYPFGFAVSTGRGYGGIAATVTNTTIVSTTHGCQNGITTALCFVAVPSVTIGSPYLCQYSVSNLDVTFQAVQSSTTVATTTGNLHYWIVGW